VTVVGGSVIGISWTALFLVHGPQLTICDATAGRGATVRAGLRDRPGTVAQLGLPVVHGRAAGALDL